MTNTSANNKRIAKNTLLLYFRMILLMLVSLYTSRVVLQQLGIEDYGIYNVVGGVVAMFGFINGSMATSTQRYLTFELGRKNYAQLSRVFSTSVIIHGLIALAVVLLAETAGLWFLYEKMTIPAERFDAALWVYHLSVLSTVVLVMSVPYNACIIAHERMSAFAYISILEAVLKLVIVFMLGIGGYDKLKLYAVLIFFVQLGIRVIYGYYCNKHFEESKFRWIKDGKLMKEMMGFAGWNLWGSCASLAFTQGLNILLNMFFTPVVNAARGVAVQVQAAVLQFSHNFQMAMNPQITKSFAAHDMAYMHSLVYRSSKFTFILLFALSLPIMIEADTILGIWLAEVPDHTATFVRLMLCVSIVDAVANPLMASAQATGSVKVYQSVVGGILLLILPISYVVLRMGGNPASVFVVHLCVCIVAFVVRLLIIRPMINLRLSQYVGKAIVPCLFVAFLSTILPLGTRFLLPHTLLVSLLNCLVGFVSVALCGYYVGLTVHERDVVSEKALAMIAKMRK